MTPKKKLTVDDVRHHAEEVRDMAQRDVQRFAEEKAVKAAVIGVVAVVALISFAYYMGSRRAVVYDYE